jgi:hypothetical protein
MVYGLEHFLFVSFFLVVLGLELRTITLSHSISPIFVKEFWRKGLMNYLPGLASKHNPPDLCLLNSKDYSHEPLVPGF